MILGTPHARLRYALIFSGLLAFPTLALAASASRRARAVAAYERAERLGATLASKPENARRRADYENLIRAYQAVYRAYPPYTKAPVALAEVAKLYADMGRQFSNDRYYLAAIQAYQFLISQYPQNRVARDALFTIGEIYRSDLENPEEARKSFQKFLEQNPKSPKASEAQAKLKQIDQLLAKRAASRDTLRRSSIAERRGTEDPSASRTPEVTAIRRWLGPSYTRIVISVEAEVKFEASRISSPDRIVFDLSDTRLSPALVGKAFPSEDGFLRQIRIAQYKPTVTRVVLDVEEIEDYSVFSLPNPFRLVIDIHGPPKAPAVKTSPPGPTPTRETTPPVAETAQAAGKTSKPVVSGPAATRQGSRPEPISKPGSSGESPKATAEAKRPALPQESGAKEIASVKPPLLPGRVPAASERAVSRTPESPSPIKPAEPTESGSRTLTRALGLKVGRTVIDPGHGGHDTGTIGPTGLVEKDVVLDVALRLKKLVENRTGSEVVMTRDADTFVPLEERTAIANQRAADLFISIHANASRDRSARGIETYYLNFTSSPEALEVAARENATSQESVHELQDLIKKIAMTEKIEESLEFATLVQREVHSRLAKGGGVQRNRGVKKAPFVVLIGANMPSILAEISFLSNPRDERLLKRVNYRQRIAEALFHGIARYMDNLGGVRVAQHTSPQPSSPVASPKF